MKNLMAFVSRTRGFYRDYEIQARLQIDNSLDLGWRIEDIIFAANFDFEYRGVKSIIVSDDNFVPFSPEGGKITAILELFYRGLIDKGVLYWFHDLDASQSEKITESEIAMGKRDIALTDYGWRDKWSTGSIFFTIKSRDIFEAIIKTMRLFEITDELALMIMTNTPSEELSHFSSQMSDPQFMKGLPKVKDLKKRINKINTSYNFAAYKNIRHCYDIALKPIRVVHFGPFGAFPKINIPSLLNYYMYGKNDIHTVLMSQRLINIYQSHGIK